MSTYEDDCIQIECINKWKEYKKCKKLCRCYAMQHLRTCFRYLKASLRGFNSYMNMKERYDDE